jgi:hypothetical protein
MNNDVLKQAADARSPQEAAEVVLDALVETYSAPHQVSLDEVKSLLVDAVRASRGKYPRDPALATSHPVSDAVSQVAPL